MQRDPYFFPFEIVDKNSLIPGDNYYIKLNDYIIKKSVDGRQNIPVSNLKGTFVRLHKEPNRVVAPREYAVFKNVFIMNKIYKQGLCRFMLVRYPEGFLAAADGCDTFSDQSQNRIVNTEREVFLDVNYWKFGKPTEEKLLAERAMNSLNLPQTMTGEISQFRGIQKPLGGRKSRKNSKKTYKRKNKISRKHKSKRRY
jgi:hypothetical protein